MRDIVPQQRRLLTGYCAHQIAEELQEISAIIDEHPELLDLVMADVMRGKSSTLGRKGLSAEQVLRILILKTLTRDSYKELAFRLVDSTASAAFCRTGIGFNRSTSSLHENLRRVRPETLETINATLVTGAMASKWGGARKIRVDCTNTSTDIHAPSDSSILWDCVRVLTRLLQRADTALDGSLHFTDHTSRAKKRAFEIQHAGSKEKRKHLYKDLLRVTNKVIAYVEAAIPVLQTSTFVGLLTSAAALAMRDELEQYLSMTKQVVLQTRRRVFDGEQVPASDKLVSIFESHTDIIKKKRRDTEYGHKLCLSVGDSCLIYDCLVLNGNPADSTLAATMVERHCELFGKEPRQTAFDGGFASKLNLQAIKELGVNDVAFNKKRGLKVEDMAKSSWVYRQLSRFRAGVEGVISYLKRCFGLGRCNWKGFGSFKAYVWSSIVTANLLTMARQRLKPAET